MSVSKRDFEAIAAICKVARKRAGNGQSMYSTYALVIIERLEGDLAGYCKAQNPNFDYETFYKACKG